MDARRARIGMEAYQPTASTKSVGQVSADMLGGVALGTTFIPGYGDVAGIVADAAMYANYPEERTMGNYALTALGALPFIPAASAVRSGRKAAETALDASQEARMARAKNLGFDTENTVYHGTAADIDRFNPLYGGSVTKAGSAKMGTWLTDNPEVAAGYARFAAEDVPIRRLLDQSSAAERAGNFKKAERLNELAENMELGGDLSGGGGQNVIPALIKGNLLNVDAGGATMSDLDESQLLAWAREAKQKGFNGLKIDNFSDNIDYGQYMPATHYLIFDPKNIRSINAAFDPAKRESSNLTAGVGGAIVGGSALRALIPQEQERRPD